MNYNLPYSPIHSKKWLENYLGKNYFKKKYDRFMWWRSYTAKKPPLTNRHLLRDRITNGDFDLGPFMYEIELVEHRINEKSVNHKHEDTFREAIQLDKARRKRLQEDRDKDEFNKLSELRKAFLLEFKMTREQYDKESVKRNRDILSFYFKMEDKYGKRAFISNIKPKGLRLASERC